MSMEWTPWYWADFAKHTGDLSPNEVGIYYRLLSHYYTTEQPLPAGAEQMLIKCSAAEERLQRICGALSPADVEALRFVVNRFFTWDNGVYRHARADEEINRSREIVEKRRKAGKTPKRKTRAQQGGSKSEASAEASAPSHAATPTPTPSIPTTTGAPAMSTFPGDEETLETMYREFEALARIRGVKPDQVQDSWGKFCDTMRSIGRMSADWIAEARKWARGERTYAPVDSRGRRGNVRPINEQNFAVAEADQPQADFLGGDHDV